MTLRRFSSRVIQRFSPQGGDEIGFVQAGRVLPSQFLIQYFDMLITRLETMMTRAGTIIMTHETSEPDGWLFLNGQQVDERLYPNLAAIYESSGGLVTLPDMSNRIPMGAGSLVSLNATAGVSEITLTIPQLPRFTPEVIDMMHTHGAIDRGHGHGLQIDSHTHGGLEDFANHTHEYASAGTIDVDAGSGATAAAPPAGETAGVTGGGDLDVAEAEVNGTVMPSQADIRVSMAKSNISIAEIGEGQSVNILNPVRGINFLVKT